MDRERERRTSSAKEDAAAAAVGHPCPEARPQRRNKAAHGRSNRTKAVQTAPSPAMQPEKQPASRMPAEAPAPHRDEAACPQQVSAHAELPPKNTAKQSQGQAPDDKGVSTPLEQAELAGSEAVLQRARKQKAAKRKAAKNKGASLQTNPSASSDGQSKAESSSQKGQHERVAAARVPAVASAKPVTQPPRTQQRSSSHGHPAPQTASEKPRPLQQSTSENVQSGPSSSSSTAPDAEACRPCPPVPDMPHGWPTDARPAPVRLSRTILQDSQSSPANFRPPPLHTLLPKAVPQPHVKQV